MEVAYAHFLYDFPDRTAGWAEHFDALPIQRGEGTLAHTFADDGIDVDQREIRRTAKMAKGLRFDSPLISGRNADNHHDSLSQ